MAGIVSSRLVQAAVLLTTVCLLANCSRLALDTYWRSELYVLVAVDARGQMSLSFDQGNGTAVGIVGPTVFSIGSDAKYIVLQQHPATNALGDFDRSVTNYFVVDRTTSKSLSDRLKGVHGPMNKAEFDRLARVESLPAFSTTFADLK